MSWPKAEARGSTSAPAPKIYTRTGDTGDTHLIGGRTSKDSARIEAIGTIDELNAALGLARAMRGSPRSAALIEKIQRELFSLGSELARGKDAATIPTRAVAQISAAHVQQMEQEIDALTADLLPLKNFVLPGGSERAARLHLARAICRRAERRVVAIKEQVRPEILRYLNRLADLLFTMARLENHSVGQRELEWK